MVLKTKMTIEHTFLHDGVFVGTVSFRNLLFFTSILVMKSSMACGFILHFFLFELPTHFVLGFLITNLYLCILCFYPRLCVFPSPQGLQSFRRWFVKQ